MQYSDISILRKKKRKEDEVFDSEKTDNKRIRRD